MTLNWIETILVGLISGFAEFLPVSAQAHQSILLKLFGETQLSPVFQLMMHGAMLLAIYMNCKQQLHVLYRELRLSQIPRRRRRRQPDMKAVLDVTLVKQAFYLLLIGYVFYPLTTRLSDDLNFLFGLLILNGILLIIPQQIRSGNKDSRTMSRLDASLFGFFAALSIFPGVSRIGASTTGGAISGADRQHSFRWALLLSIPAISFLIGFDIANMFESGMGIYSAGDFVQCAVSSIFTYLGSFLAIRAMRFLSFRAGYSAFAFYSWGAALFSFILFLAI